MDKCVYLVPDTIFRRPIQYHFRGENVMEPEATGGLSFLYSVWLGLCQSLPLRSTVGTSAVRKMLYKQKLM